MMSRMDIPDINKCRDVEYVAQIPARVMINHELNKSIPLNTKQVEFSKEDFLAKVATIVPTSLVGYIYSIIEGDTLFLFREHSNKSQLEDFFRSNRDDIITRAEDVPTPSCVIFHKAILIKLAKTMSMLKILFLRLQPLMMT